MIQKETQIADLQYRLFAPQQIKEQTTKICEILTTINESQQEAIQTNSELLEIRTKVIEQGKQLQKLKTQNKKGKNRQQTAKIKHCNKPTKNEKTNSINQNEDKKRKQPT